MRIVRHAGGSGPLLRSAAQWSAPLLYPFDRNSYSRLESTPRRCWHANPRHVVNCIYRVETSEQRTGTATRTGFHPLETKYAGNITVKTGRRLSSATFTVHRRKSGAQSAKEEIIITRFIRRTAMECAAARSLASLPMSSGKS